MGRPPCCDKSNVKRGPWTAEEDAKILAYVSNHGIGNWTLVPKKAGLDGLNRCGKSCRLRWTNYLRPDLKHDNFTPEEEDLIIKFHKAIGSRWSFIAKQLPGRTDNDVKNYWNTKLRKKLQKMGIDPITHKPILQILSDYGNIRGIPNQNGSLNKTLITNLISKTEPSSVFTSELPCSSAIIMNPSITDHQIHDNSSSTTSKPLWEFMSQVLVTNRDTIQPHFFSPEVSSSCSSSSSSATFAQLSSPQSSSCQQQENEITPSPPFVWSEFLLSDPALSVDFQQQQDQDFHGMLLSTNCSTLTQNEASDDCKITRGNGHQHFQRVGHEGFDQSSDYGASSNGDEANYQADASPSFASNSFVDGILDKDREMCLQFPELLDPSFDY